MRHYLAQLRMLISDLKTCLSEVKDDKLPNEWLLVSDIKMIVNTGSLEFKKELSSDDDLLNILIKYSKMGFGTDRGKSGYSFVGDGLFSYVGPKCLEEELSNGIFFIDTINYYLDAPSGRISINWRSIRQERLIAGLSNSSVGYKPNDKAVIKLLVPTDCVNLIEYLI